MDGKVFPAVLLLASAFLVVEGGRLQTYAGVKEALQAGKELWYVVDTAACQLPDQDPADPRPPRQPRTSVLTGRWDVLAFFQNTFPPFIASTTHQNMRRGNETHMRSTHFMIFRNDTIRIHMTEGPPENETSQSHVLFCPFYTEDRAGMKVYTSDGLTERLESYEDVEDSLRHGRGVRFVVHHYRCNREIEASLGSAQLQDAVVEDGRIRFSGGQLIDGYIQEEGELFSLRSWDRQGPTEFNCSYSEYLQQAGVYFYSPRDSDVTCGAPPIGSSVLVTCLLLLLLNLIH